MASICVLGGGLVGRYIAVTLDGRGHDVRLVDLTDIEDLPPSIVQIQQRIELDDVTSIVAGSDVVVNCLPGRVGHAVRAPLLSIEGMRVADLAFTAEDPREFHSLALEHGSELLFDLGIAPGLSNLLVADALLDGPADSARIWVGGNPQVPDDDWSYMAPFSPSDVIEEYTRPARILRDGKIVAAPALSERHRMMTPCGEMEAFLTDGVRSLLDTVAIPNLIEYTLRWPGHIDRYLAGDFLETDLIEAWRFDPARPEFTYLRVEVGDQVWTVFDAGGPDGSSMARTTGLVCVDVAEMMAEGDGLGPGVYAPEALVQTDALRRILTTLDAAGVSIEG